MHYFLRYIFFSLCLEAIIHFKILNYLYKKKFSFILASFLKFSIYVCIDKSVYSFRSQLELEGKVADLMTELSVKDETINKYVSRLQCFCEKLKGHAKRTNEVISHPMINDQNYDVSVLFIIFVHR